MVHTVVMPDAHTAWNAVATRDRAFDGRFVYGVTSTRIFCRPSCPSRRPRRDRMRVFATPADAAAAGFRACRRCRPASVGPTSAEAAVRRALAYLDQHQDGRVRLADLAKVTGQSAWHLQRTFRKLVGLSPREYLAARRADRLRAGLRQEASVSRATYEAGFGSSSRVYEGAPRLLGMTPGTFRKGGEGMEIRYTIVSSPYGRLLVAATDRGVCAVMLGENDARLARDLGAQFPRAACRRVDDGDTWLAGLVSRVAEELRHPGQGAGIPLDLHGTAFQWRVWQALVSIPAGETRTYGEVARSIGKPRSVRAVAGACAANRVAVVVPCHRVVRTDGTLGGYRWGLPRKQRLLEAERRAAG
ncbi:MAG TPA: bifunctional DNA-binding transcriptional regulator/O6-methylguanine-DNA methyltransferase Ada [Streptosporangiaceae bacterium]